MSASCNTAKQNPDILQMQVEGMVRAKMEQKEYIILCLEDSNDWSNATTRRLVMQARIASSCPCLQSVAQPS